MTEHVDIDPVGEESNREAQTDAEVDFDEPGIEAEPTKPEARPATPASTHLRPLPSPLPEEGLFATPGRLPPARTKPTTAKPESPSEPSPAQQQGEQSTTDKMVFPVAKPPPSVGRGESDDDTSRAQLPSPPRTEPTDTDLAHVDVATTRSDAARDLDTGLDPVEEAAIDLESDRETVGLRRGSLFGYVLYLALAVGTTPLPGEVRYTVLWLVLLGLGSAFLLFDEEDPLSGPISLVRLSWGLGIGFVLSLPMMLTASHALSRAAAALVPIPGLPALFQSLVVVWPLGETLFYRGVIQREYGLAPAALAATVGNLLLYWPETGGVFAVLFISTIFAAVLALIYGYVRRQYGLAAAFTCQAMSNFMLIFLPRLLVPAA